MFVVVRSLISQFPVPEVEYLHRDGSGVYFWGPIAHCRLFCLRECAEVVAEEFNELYKYDCCHVDEAPEDVSSDDPFEDDSVDGIGYDFLSSGDFP